MLEFKGINIKKLYFKELTTLENIMIRRIFKKIGLLHSFINKEDIIMYLWNRMWKRWKWFSY